MEKAYTDENTFSKSDHNLIIKPQSAMVVCDPKGDCLGIVGGRGEKLLNRGLNYATQTKRSPGSSIKPLSVYSPALELGLITPGTIVDDIPYSFDKNYNDWPKNVNKTYQGLKTVAYAVRVSLNTSAVRVLDLVGIERSYEFTQKLGLESLEEKYITSSGAEMTDLGQAPLAMGATTLGVTVREMASAYTTFRNNGIHTKSRTYSLVTDADGNTVTTGHGRMVLQWRQLTNQPASDGPGAVTKALEDAEFVCGKPAQYFVDRFGETVCAG